MQDIDVLSDSPDNGSPTPDSPALKTISTLANEYDLLEKDLVILKERIRVREDRMKLICEKAMPMAMQEAGVVSFVASNGRSIKIEDRVNGNIPAQSTIDKAKGEEREKLIARRAAALTVIREKWSGLMKTEVSVSLGKGETSLATSIAELIRKQFQLTPSIDESVNHQTLNAHFRELKENGRLGEVPVEPFALYIGPFAKIK